MLSILLGGTIVLASTDIQWHRPQIPLPADIGDFLPSMPLFPNTLYSEIGPGILLVNFPGEPKWDEDWEETALIAFKVLPENLKKLVTKERPLQLGLVREAEFGGGYYPLTNTILINWRAYENFPWIKKRYQVLELIFHEFGHAVDKYLGIISNREWRDFLSHNQQSKGLLWDPRANSPLESFAEFFRSYILPRDTFDWMEMLPNSRDWFKQYVFQEEPKREYFSLKLDGYVIRRLAEDLKKLSYPKSFAVFPLGFEVNLENVEWRLSPDTKLRLAGTTILPEYLSLEILLSPSSTLKITMGTPKRTVAIDDGTYNGAQKLFKIDDPFDLGVEINEEMLKKDLKSYFLNLGSGFPSVEKELENSRLTISGYLVGEIRMGKVSPNPAYYSDIETKVILKIFLYHSVEEYRQLVGLLKTMPSITTFPDKIVDFIFPDSSHIYITTIMGGREIRWSNR